MSTTQSPAVLAKICDHLRKLSVETLTDISNEAWDGPVMVALYTACDAWTSTDEMAEARATAADIAKDMLASWSEPEPLPNFAEWVIAA